MHQNDGSLRTYLFAIEGGLQQLFCFHKILQGDQSLCVFKPNPLHWIGICSDCFLKRWPRGLIVPNSPEQRSCDGKNRIVFRYYLERKDRIFFDRFCVSVNQIDPTKQKVWWSGIVIYDTFSDIATFSFVLIRYGWLTRPGPLKSIPTSKIQEHKILGIFFQQSADTNFGLFVAIRISVSEQIIMFLACTEIFVSFKIWQIGAADPCHLYLHFSEYRIGKFIQDIKKIIDPTIKLQWPKDNASSVWSSPISNGSSVGQYPNSGIIMTADGVATFEANGCRNITEDGGVEFRGCIIFETMAPSLSLLDGKAHMYTLDVDLAGNPVWHIGNLLDHVNTEPNCLNPPETFKWFAKKFSNLA